MPNGFDAARSSFEHSVIINFVVGVAQIVLNFIAANFNGLAGFLNDMQTRILGAITANTNSITKVVTQSVSIAEQNILAGILDLDSSVSNAEINILAEVSNNTNLLDIVVGALHDGINVEINNEVLVTDSLFTTLLGSVQSVLSENNAGISEAVGIIGNIFSGSIQEILRNIVAESLDEQLLLQKIIEAILRNKEATAPVIDAVLNDSDEGLGAVVTKSAFQTFFDSFTVGEGELSAATDIVDLDAFQHSVDMFCDLLGVLRARPASEATDAVYGVVADVLTTVLFPLAMHGADTARCLAVWSKDNPWKVLEPADVARMFYLGILDEKDAATVISMSGYGLGDAADLLNSAQTIPSIDFIITMWLREKIDDDGFHFALKQLGYNKAYAEAIEKIAFFIPPVQDLITMSVREVFTPSIRARNRQDENFPPEFAKFAAQQGVSDEWAKNYWAAHWVLPSIQMGFEMLHRGFIEDDRLRELMQALDVMPGWVDEIIKISFQPVTRIDIRRLNSVGLLEDQELRKAYKNIGYSPEDAELLSNFTEILNADEEILTFDVASDLTRSNIIGFYVDGILNRIVTLGLLIQAGINLAAAELFLSDADFRIERRERKQRVDLILDEFRFGGATFIEANDRLAGLGLESVELQLAQLELARLQLQETKLPSRADLDKFVKLDIIDDTEYIENMVRIGYSRLWAVRYLESAGVA